MTSKEIADKLWRLSDILRDDGITYHQYLNELTIILFLKMAEETEKEDKLPEQYRWKDLTSKDGIELKEFYQELILVLGGAIPMHKNKDGVIRVNLSEAFLANPKNKKEKWKKVKIDKTIQKIYAHARTNIDEPKNLKKIITDIDELDWYSAKQEGLGNMYEDLLGRNAGDKKSGAGQYFTPRALINVMVRCMKPKLKEYWNDPACGTFGFMIAIDRYLRKKHNNYDEKGVNATFQQSKALSGVELVKDAYRLALMNAILHDLTGESLELGDTLSQFGEKFTEQFDGVLANPPFGTKKGGERLTHKKLIFKTQNKQLNFIQHIYLSLHKKGGSRAAVILPDNVLFANGEGQSVRKDLMDKCNLHTILRLPARTFDYAGVQTNVLFFERGKKEKGNTKEVWFYDLRTDMPSFGKRNPLTEAYFEDFEKAYHAKDRKKINDPRWSVVNRSDIAVRDENLEIGLMESESANDYKDLPAPTVIAKATKVKLYYAIKQLEEMIAILEN